MIHLACDQMMQGWIGRQLPRLFRQAGLSNIWINGRLMPIEYPFFRMVFTGILQRAQAAGAVTQEELTRFWDALEQAETDIPYFHDGI